MVMGGFEWFLVFMVCYGAITGGYEWFLAGNRWLWVVLGWMYQYF